jgi:hypothetical protein
MLHRHRLPSSTMPHDPRRAWLRALAYFTMCWALALGAGAEAYLVTTIGAVDAAWWWLTGAGLAWAVVGYWIIWPMGTRTYGRPIRPLWVAVFGVLWGASEGMLLLTAWSLIARLDGPPGLTIALSVLATGGFLGLWHALYWDVHVAPEHNIPEWNARKVLLVHFPFLLLALTHLTRYEQGIPFVAMQVVALLGATTAMRFPAPRSDLG